MPTRDRPAGASLLVQCLIISLFAGLLLLDIWIFLIRGHGSLQAKLELLLEILALYTFMFGFLAQTGILDHFEDLIRDMTSPNLYEFLRANLVFLTILFSTLAVALDPKKARYGPSYPLELLLLLVVGSLVFVYAVFHILVIVPIVYLPYVMVSIPLRNIQASEGDIVIQYGKGTVNIKDVVSSNEVSVRNLLIAVPAMVLALVVRVGFAVGWGG
ncbi:MAG: hypothetical protein U9N13_06465 [Euryarchaeota archaeon]|nr:hypothetical protein [Euryarchaeota archaeon]